MRFRRQLPRQLIVPGTTLAILAVVGLLLWFLAQGPGEPPEAQPAALPTSASDPGVVSVNGVPISRELWRETALVDQVVSNLAGSAPPTPEESLDQLIDQMIVLQATAPRWPERQEIEQYIQAREVDWRASDQAVVFALNAAGLTRAALENNVARLLAVQHGIEQLAAEGHTDVEAWLAAQRGAAEIVPLQAVASGDFYYTPPVPTAVLPVVASGGMAPLFALSDLDGSMSELASFSGRPVSLYFAEPAAASAVADLSLLDKLRNQQADPTAPILAISASQPAQTLLDAAGAMGDVRILIDPGGGVTYGAYRVKLLPTTVLVDSSGMVLAVVEGPLSEEALARAASASPAPAMGTAPDFTLPASTGAPFTLSTQLLQGPVVLVFYQGGG